MADEKSKLIPFTKELEAAIDADAKRCERSFVRQVVAVLKSYYEIESVEIKKPQLEMLGEIAPKSNKSLPLIEATVETAKKKRSA